MGNGRGWGLHPTQGQGLVMSNPMVGRPSPLHSISGCSPLHPAVPESPLRREQKAAHPPINLEHLHMKSLCGCPGWCNKTRTTARLAIHGSYHEQLRLLGLHKHQPVKSSGLPLKWGRLSPAVGLRQWKLREVERRITQGPRHRLRLVGVEGLREGHHGCTSETPRCGQVLALSFLRLTLGGGAYSI